MKQTVVEWLIDQLEKKGDASVNMSIGRMQISIIEEDYINLLEQAKEMQEQQQGYSKEDMLKLVNALNKISQFSDIGNDFSAVVKMKSIAVDAINQFKNK